MNWIEAGKSVARRIPLLGNVLRAARRVSRTVQPQSASRHPEASPAPLVSVVLGSYNRLPLLQEAIESVRAHDFPGEYELIVVDGGSTDGALEWLVAQKDVLTIVQHNRGEFLGKALPRRSWGYFMNLAFKAAKGRWVLMISDDCLLLEGAVTAGLDAAQQAQQEGRSVGGVAFYFRNWPLEQRYYVQETLGGRLMVNHGLYDRHAFEQIGWVDEDRYMFYKADGDVSLRLWQAGHEVIAAPGAFVEHFMDTAEVVRQSNNTTLQNDQLAYGRRWEGIYHFPGKPSAAGKRYAEFVDPRHTAETVWGRKLGLVA